MATCNNCRVKLGCSCKRRTASNGASCCANCIASYEKKLKNPPQQNKFSGTSPGVILSATAVQKN
jgi:hypothetical protein